MSNLSDEDKNFLDGGNDSDAAFLEGDSNDESNLGPVTHGLAVVGERVLHALPDAAGFLGDLGADAVNVVRNKYRKMTGSDLPDERLYLPGMGPASEVVHKSFQEGEQKHGPIPQARNGAERILGSIAEGAATGLIGGPEGAGMGVASGASGGAAAGVTQEITDNPYVAYVAGLIGGLSPAGIHGIRSVRGSTVIARGASHPDFENAWSAVVSNEGGGSLEHPLTNEKSGAFGPAQVTPDTLRQPGYGIKPWDGTVADSVRVGRQKFAALLGKYDGDTGKAMAGYNWGEGNVDRAVRKYGADWLKHAPEETQNYVNKGLLKTYGGGDLPENGSVRPMDPQDIAGIMNDPEAARQISDTPIGDEATAQPIDTSDNVVSLNDIRNQKQSEGFDNAIADNIDFARRVHRAIDEGVITDRHIPNIENARGNLLDILDNSSEELNKAQIRAINNNVAMLDDALQRLGAGSDQINVLRNSDHVEGVIGKGESGEPANDARGLTDAEITEPNPVADAEDRSHLRVPAPEGVLGKRLGSLIKTIKDRTEPPRRSENGHDDMPPPSDEPTVAKLVDAINQAKPIRNQQKIAISKARAERFQKVAQIYATAEGPAAYRMALKAMKGDMPKADFEGIGHQFDANEIQFLFDKVGKSNRLTPGEKLTGHSGLQKLLASPAGQVPTASELNVLSQVFPKELVTGLQKENPFAHVVAQALNTPRTLMASFDLSAPLRQGIFLIGRKEFYKAWGPMFKQFFSEKAFKASQDEIASRPSFRLMQKAKLALTDEGDILTKREEAFMSNWAEKFPVIGHGVRASSRAYMGFLNRLRADTFDTLIRQAQNEGLDLEHDYHALHSIARFINNATGRGDLGRWNTAAPVLNGIFFSPRLIASRINTMNPVWYATLHPFARRQALKSLLSFSAVALTVIGLAKMGGADVEHDPRSADFGKIKVGNTRYDILGGYQQFIRTGAQLIAGSTKGPDGSIKPLNSDKFGSKTRLDVAQNFVYNKTSPVASFVLDWMRGKDAVGNKFQLDKELANRVTPMVAQDARDLYKDGGMGEVPGVIPGIFGVGVQTYTPRPKKSVGRPKSSDSFLNENSNLNDKFLSGTADSDDAFLKGNP